MSRVKLNLLERCAVEIIWAVCWFITLLPHFVLYYILAPTIKVVLYHIIRYRRKVVTENLRASFPERSVEERDAISSRFYTILAEIIVSIIAMTHRRSIESVFSTMATDPKTAVLAEPELHTNSWVALTAHYGLWEYLVVWSRLSNQRLLAVYHPLQNRIFDELFKRFRAQKMVETMPSSETIRFVIRNGATYKGESYVLGLIADQNPPRLLENNWYSFLNQDTIFFEGGEKIAMRVGLPVYFAYQHRHARGKYDFRMRQIWDGVESVEPTEITRRYVEELQAEIRRCPEMWLWSHKRWKAKRDPQTEERSV